ncbi:MAG: aminotransferase [Propionicimonas sp.]|uniref:aminotransferase n=1 Tax=Propionicimonas sp. TaxID=1955623 RepID=UPI001D43EE48|nr:aminotransferase [Propionicimonas sp.]MBU4186756.1 aminotransferase [Actinomycetota bacterium]MBU4206086.1 aminotransferase [Actinomycetota bacterium]MBU4249391.1 aminotransferase [Actinomycetota bacterium]MBU4410612.1 aminotransferase [Actinomycetota bacterium]MBU4417603.1 aminotransferase [Actinomycetota bacterium]
MSLPSQSFDFFAHGELPAPALSLPEAAEVLASLGVAGQLTELGSQQDQNFLITGAGGPFGVLKLANPAFPERDTLAQDAAADLVANGFPELRVAAVLRREGVAVRAVAQTSLGPLVARVLNYLPGGTYVDQPWLSPAVAAQMGRIAAQVSAALAGFEHPGLERRLQWDLRSSAEVVELLAPAIGDPAEREAVLAAARAAWAVVAELAEQLPVQAGHFDLTDDNLVRGAGGLPDGVIDFGDVSRSWRVAELAVTLSGLLHHSGPLVETVLAAVRGFHGLRPLSSAEVDALWPLVVLRGAVLVASGRQQAELDADNAYAQEALEREWRIFATATSRPAAVMTGIIRHALGMASAPGAVSGGALLAESPSRLDLGVAAASTNDGAWLEPGLADRLAAELGGVVAASWGGARLSESRPLSAQAPATVATSVTLWTDAPIVVRAPWPGTVTVLGDRLVLSGAAFDLVLVGDGSSEQLTGTVPPSSSQEPSLRAAHGNRPRAQLGSALATFDGRAEVQLVIHGLEVPLLVPADEAPGWLALTADPAALLGLASTAPAQDPAALLAERTAHVAEVQEHYYADPPQIERGWRAQLVDTGARAYLDMVNNVTSVGHAHPRITAAVASQLARLNTNSRFHYAALPRFAEALAETLPDGLDQVFLVNSGSEATDLAIRLAMAATGRRDIVALAEAYHGWTYASDAVSTSVADNPNALATRPDWVHTVEAPNSYRGRLRDGDSLGYGPAAARRIRELADAGHAPAGFIAESISGNAGGIVLPKGYLGEVYAAVREAGGLAIADEVQVGYGRLGDWFWGFEQQEVVPDIVAVAKSMGNGHPLGAVITTKAVAEAYRAGGYFFSSTGGSPVSATVGLTVLDIIRDEGLQTNARQIGARLKAGLTALSQRHDSVGTVHGHGLYLGLELVSDRAARTPDAALTRDLCERLRQLGVIMQPTGDHGNVLKIKPPLVVTADEVDFFVAMVDRALGELR